MGLLLTSCTLPFATMPAGRAPRPLPKSLELKVQALGLLVRV